eukprot:m.138335 g.138335  ORF g.138335 m.138335 type:complete len:273 (+) comp29984_c0_seq1:126-944(+)
MSRKREGEEHLQKDEILSKSHRTHEEADVATSLDPLEAIQSKLNILSEQAAEEILQVNIKYTHKRTPLYRARSVVISKVPQFWLTVLLNSEIGALVIPEDEPVLQHCVKINVDESDGGSFKIEFVFSPNAFLLESCLTLSKEYKLNPEDGVFVCRATKPQWVDGCDPAGIAATTSTPASSAQQHTMGERQTIRGTTEATSAIEQRDDDDDDDRDGDGENMNMGSFFDFFVDDECVLPDGQEVGMVIKEVIWPDPLKMYLLDVDGDDDDDDDQ